jgi:pyroglutamyl-peptidase
MLPVDRVTGPATLVMAVESFKPDVVLCLGQATGRAALSIERVAVNLLDYAIADNSGAVVTDEPIVPDGPAAYFVTLPVRRVRDAIRAAGVPAELSLSAGAFLCNQVLYTLLHHIAVNRQVMRAGFIHVPALPEQIVNERHGLPSMSLETMVVGVRAAIQAML